MVFKGGDPEDERDDFLNLVKARFANLVQNRTLRFYGINEPNLKKYKNTDGLDSDYDHCPPEESRLKDEEIQSGDEHQRQTELENQLKMQQNLEQNESDFKFVARASLKKKATFKEEEKVPQEDIMSFENGVPLLQIDLTKGLEVDNLKDKVDELNKNMGLPQGLLSEDEDDNKEVQSFDDIQSNFEKQLQKKKTIKEHENTINRRLTNKEQKELQNVTMI